MLKIPTSAHISWNTFDDKTVQRDDQESIFLATFVDAITGEKHKHQIDYSFYNRGKFEANPLFILEVYSFQDDDDPINYLKKEYQSLGDAENDINEWLRFFHEKALKPILSKNLKFANEQVYEKLNLAIFNVLKETESIDYQAFIFKLNNAFIVYREAKVTPIKIGQFVTLWKRNLGQPIEPFHRSDNVNFVIVTTQNDDKLGQFIFPKSVLIEKNIISTDTKEGKRAFRVYPPWDLAENKQAVAAQKWQLQYFLDISNQGKIDLERAKILLI